MGLFSTAKLFGMTIRESATDGSDFTNPDADYRRLFLGEDGQLHVKDSAGTVTDIGASSGNVATDAIWDAAGDLAVGTGANTAARVAIGTSGQVLTSNGTTAAWSAPRGNMWQMSLSSSQTLTNNTLTTITWDRGDIDGGGSVIDLANDRFVIPATGFYMIIANWLWEGTAPLVSAYMQAMIGGSATTGGIIRGPMPTAATAVLNANQGLNGSLGLALTASDNLTLGIHPQAVTGVTARGNAALYLSSSFTLIRVA